MTIYTLYVKTNKKTGLKYLGQTSRNPFKYSGSGIDWKSHLVEFGNDVHTEILLQTTDKSERNNLGRYLSALWHVVTAADDFGNKLWANRIPETGGGQVTDTMMIHIRIWARIKKEKGIKISQMPYLNHGKIPIEFVNTVMLPLVINTIPKEKVM